MISQYSVVIPCFRRYNELRTTLTSLAKQTVLPEATLLIDNNESSMEKVKLLRIVDEFRTSLNTKYIKSNINSGAIARQTGVSQVQTPYTLFLDSDVLLDSNYVDILISHLDKEHELLGAQGVDRILQRSYRSSRSSSLKYFFNRIYELMGISSSYAPAGQTLKVLPSLCVQNPENNANFSTCSEWLSTCAGVFRTNIFKSYSFDQNFIKYSWNEYLLLSRQVSLETNQYYLFTSSASYTSIITESGRMSNVPLMYMAESYDLYIFHKLFRTNLVNVIVYLTSRIGRLIFYFLKTIKTSH